MADEKDEATEEGESNQRELVPSELDEITHAEMRLLYEDASIAVRYARAQQWKTVSGMLFILGAMIVTAEFTAEHKDFIKNIVIAALLVAAGAIYMLIILQLTQNTEREKIRFTVSYFSNVARENFNIESSTESNIQRYIMLTFMILSIIIGNAVLIMVLSRFYR